MQQVVQPVATAVDDVKSIAAEVIGIEGANQDANHDTDREHHGHISVLVVHVLLEFNAFKSSMILIAQVYDFDTGTLQQFDAVGKAIFLAIHHSLDASLDDELSTLYARRGGDINRRAVAIV